MRLRHFVPLLLILATAGCRLSEEITAPIKPDSVAPSRASKRHDRSDRGAVYVQTNAVAGNAVLAFSRQGDGTLGSPASYSTGGTGTGSGLGNQGGVILSPDARWLFVVNSGSNEISSFQVRAGGLRLVDKVGSGGTRPISLTASGDRLFVLNIGGDGNVVGFKIRGSGNLERIRGASRPLSGSATNAAQIGFSPDGDHLVVTERATNRISVYTLGRSRGLAGPVFHASSGMTPFGFAFDRNGTLIVAEAFGGAPGASAASSYHFEQKGDLELVSGSVPTTQTSACWLAVSGDSRFAYTANTGGGTITGYRIGAGGSLTRLQADGVSANPGGGPGDLAFGAGGRYLYVRNGGTNRIDIFVWHSDGTLEAIGQASLPAGTNGMAAN